MVLRPRRSRPVRRSWPAWQYRRGGAFHPHAQRRGARARVRPSPPRYPLRLIGGQLIRNVGPTNDNRADGKVACRSRLGGLLNYCHREAACASAMDLGTARVTTFANEVAKSVVIDTATRRGRRASWSFKKGLRASQRKANLLCSFNDVAVADTNIQNVLVRSWPDICRDRNTRIRHSALPLTVTDANSAK
jgi:hypothetical protein